MSRHRAKPPSENALRHFMIDIEEAPFHVFWTPEDDTVRAAGFFDPNELLIQLADDLQRREIVDEDTGQVPEALRAYAAGNINAIDALTVDQPGSEFRSQVWKALRTVPAGEAVTYTELAALAGRPNAIRAAASSCATNLIALIVPCHRVTKIDGTVGDYGYGAALKERLLRFEGAL